MKQCTKERKTRRSTSSFKELRDDEARGHITNLRLSRHKRGASVFWRVQGEVRRHSHEGNSEKLLRGGGLFEMPR